VLFSCLFWHKGSDLFISLGAWVKASTNRHFGIVDGKEQDKRNWTEPGKK
jgi:hypothetical protein